MKKSNILKHKGYIGSIEIEVNEGFLYGKVQGLSGVLLSYQGNTLKELATDFTDAVDEYLADCKKQGIEPQKTFSGVFNVRVETELHKQAFMLAKGKGITLNKFIHEAVEKEVNALTHSLV